MIVKLTTQILFRQVISSYSNVVKMKVDWLLDWSDAPEHYQIAPEVIFVLNIYIYMF